MNRRRRTLRWTLMWTLTLVPLCAAAEQPHSLKSFSAEYSLRRGYLEFAKVEVVLRLSGNGDYVYRAHTIPTGLTAVLHSDEITETSQGRIAGDRILPAKYRYLHDKSFSPRDVNLSFDWDELRVTNSTSDSRWLMKIKPGTQDKFSQQLRLMSAVSQGQRSVRFPVADGGLTKEYSFQVQEAETVITPMGEFQAYKVVRSKNGRASRASLWLAPDLNYLPVKVERRENDGEYVMELVSVRWD